MTARSVSKICSVEGCDTSLYKVRLGLCNKHYKRQMRYGSTDARNHERQPCVVPECNKLRNGHGYCHTHYDRIRRNGTLALQYTSPLENPAVFWAQATITADPTRCWEWQRRKDKNGYGCVYLQSKPSAKAHQLAFFLHNGYWAFPMVRHTCDNPPCCNPNHLIQGTAADNSRDAVERGRIARGEQSGSAKLTEDNVREIKRRVKKFPTGMGKGDPDSKKALAEEFGVTRAVIRLIVENRMWRHVD